MVLVFSRLVRRTRLFWAGLALLALAGCQVAGPVNTGGGANRAGTVEVALLLPYGSAQNGDEVVAKALEDAARMAVSDLSDVQIDLRVYSTAGNAETGAAAAQRAVSEGADVILGPLYADVAAAVGVAVRNRNIPVLSFSNNTDIAGGNVFVLGNTFQNTAERIVSYGVAQGRNRVAVIHSNDATGAVARAAVERAIAVSGATLVTAVSYELSQSGVVQAVPAVQSAVRSSGANAIFLTSSTSGALPLFAQLLPEAGITPERVQYMGLARWDVPAEALTLPGLQNGWFALPDQALANAFQARFSASYGRSAHPLAGLSYDGIAAISAASQAGGAIRPETLTRPAGFAGVNGVFRLRADGTNQRALSIAQIVNAQVQVISPAPRRFSPAGS